MNPNTDDLTGYDVFVGDLDCGAVSGSPTTAVIDLANVNLVAHRIINLGSV